MTNQGGPEVLIASLTCADICACTHAVPSKKQKNPIFLKLRMAFLKPVLLQVMILSFYRQLFEKSTLFLTSLARNNYS